MKDKIKGILEDIKEIYYFKPLLDYITNLQEELKSANESISWWQNRFNAVEKENEKLKENKIDKAIEYIINHSEEYKPHFRKIELDTVQCNELLNILEENK